MRLAILTVVLIYLRRRARLRASTRPELSHGVPVRAIEFVVGIGILVWIAMRPGVSHSGACVGMVADYTMMGAACT